MQLVATESSIIPAQPTGKIQLPPTLAVGSRPFAKGSQPFEIGILGQKYDRWQQRQRPACVTGRGEITRRCYDAYLSTGQVDKLGDVRFSTDEVGEYFYRLRVRERGACINFRAFRHP
jgi:hypothetical protein